MSWSLSPAKDLSADLRLTQAISEFKTSLTSREKLDFEAQEIKYNLKPPTTRDVYRLTAAIDQACEKASGGRVFGPRFMNILQAVQRFASLGDILVGGSQNLIACGVWTGVRFALVILASNATAMNQISELFMHIGQQAPKYEELAHLYPDSKVLQDSLFNYFIEIIHLCEYLVRHARKTTIQHLIHIFGDSGVDKFKTQLHIHGRAIKDEITILTTSLINAEASRSEKFRARYLGESQLAVLKRQAKLRGQVLDYCSTYDHETAWKDLRKAGTAQLHLQEEAYARWKSKDSPSTLIWQGKIGCGKSVLLANIIEDLHVNSLESNTWVTYFFCQWSVAESLQAKVVLGSLARQILKISFGNTCKDPVQQANILTSKSVSLEELTALIIRSIPNGISVAFVIDGVDECPKYEATRIFTALKGLQAAVNIKICISTAMTPLHDLITKSLADSLTDLSTIIVPEENPDIATFVDIELANRLQSGELVLGDGSLILEIRDALLRGAQGMILWVVHQMDAICAEKSDEGIRQALQDLPTTLSEVFRRELDRYSRTSSCKYRDRIINLLLATVRPLELEEFREALSVEPGNTDWQPAKHLNDVRSVLVCCGRLISINEELTTVGISHHSIKKYLSAEYLQADGIALSQLSAQEALANVIVTYLSYGVFDRQVSTRVMPHLSTKPVVPAVLASAFNPLVSTKLALKLLQLKKATNLDIGKTVAKLNHEEVASHLPDFPFRKYAEKHYLYHARIYLVQENPQYVVLLQSVIARLAPDAWEFAVTMRSSPTKYLSNISNLSTINLLRWSTTNLPQMEHATRLKSISPFSWASDHGLVGLITYGHKGGDPAVDILTLVDIDNLTCLDWAATRGTPNEVMALVKLREDEFISERLLRTLGTALRVSNFETANFLVDAFDNGFDPNLVFEAALFAKNMDIIRWMLNNKAANLTREIDWHLQQASINFRTPVRRELQSRGYFAHSYPPLFIAIFLESTQLVNYLREKGFPASELSVVLPHEEYNRIFSFLVRHELTAVWQRMMLVNSEAFNSIHGPQRYSAISP